MKELFERYPTLLGAESQIEAACKMLINGFRNGSKLLLCGNGGSCADCEHITGELMKGFLSKRPLSEKQKAIMRKNSPEINDNILDKLQNAVPTIPLTAFTVLNTAFCNDVDPELIYAQALMGLGKVNDMLFCISTSGNSKNVVVAAKVAKALGLKVISLTGKTGGKLKEVSDICICVPETETFKVQELHLPLYHHLCVEIEKNMFECSE